MQSNIITKWNKTGNQADGDFCNATGFLGVLHVL